MQKREKLPYCNTNLYKSGAPCRIGWRPVTSGFTFFRSVGKCRLGSQTKSSSFYKRKLLKEYLYTGILYKHICITKESPERLLWPWPMTWNCSTFINRNLSNLGSPCASDPCLNGGTCSNNGQSFSCSCPVGYNGDRCEIEGINIIFKNVWYCGHVV